MSTTTNILIVGGGFAGVKAALALSKTPDCSITLVSDHSHFRYYPTLFHAATGGRRAGARIRLSNILQGSKVTFIRATAQTLNRQKKYVETTDGQKLHYDAVLLALGNVTNYFGIKGLQEHAFGIKSSEEAERFKQHLHDQFIDNGCPDLNYVIVGGGPTGIELAGALPGYLRHVMGKHHITDCPLRITLVEASPRLLPRSAPAVSEAITKRLQSLGITLLLDTSVKGASADALMAGDTKLQTHTIVWTAGVTNHPFFKANQFALTDRGKVEVDEYLQAEPNIYVLGDNANTPFSGMAQTALHDGLFVAENIKRQLRGEQPVRYVPKQPVSVIPVGSHWASVEWGKHTFFGWIGWVLRALANLIGFHDLESWPKAGEQWLTSMESEKNDCVHCRKK